MKCPKCKGLMAYESPRYEGESGGARCMICGHWIFEPRKVVMPEVPAIGKDRSYAFNRPNLQKAREAKAAGNAQRAAGGAGC